jgi:hypothetical protein
MIVNGSVMPRPSVWIATVDSSQRPSVGKAFQKLVIPITSTFFRMPRTSTHAPQTATTPQPARSDHVVDVLERESDRRQSSFRLTLTADHRIIDSALGAQFLRTLARLTEEPQQLLI